MRGKGNFRGGDDRGMPGKMRVSGGFFADDSCHAYLDRVTLAIQYSPQHRRTLRDGGRERPLQFTEARPVLWRPREARGHQCPRLRRQLRGNHGRRRDGHGRLCRRTFHGVGRDGLEPVLHILVAEVGVGPRGAEVKDLPHRDGEGPDIALGGPVALEERENESFD